MTMDEPTRYEMFLWFTDHMPRHVAEAMMEANPPTGWGDIATRNDLDTNAVLLRGEMAEVRGDMAEVRGEMVEVRGEIAQVGVAVTTLQADLNGFKAEVRGDFAEMRGEFALRFARTDRTIVIAALATAASSWAASFTALGLG